MKKNLLMIILVLCLLVLPIKTNALKYNNVDYKTLNLDQALTEEAIEHDFSNYKENDKQAIIYLFRGKGCQYCRALLTHLNDIIGDMGAYFKVVSFEVYKDGNNSKLMNEVSDFMNANVTGIPFYIIGDKTFVGYGASYDEDIKNAIMDAYNAKDKYDVFEEMSKPEPTPASNTSVIIWSLVFAIVSTTAIISVNCYQYSKLNKKIAALETKLKAKNK